MVHVNIHDHKAIIWKIARKCVDSIDDENLPLAGWARYDRDVLWMDDTMPMDEFAGARPAAPLVINLFGAPHTGKTKLAFALFGALSASDRCVDFAGEFARDLSLEDNRRALSCQPYVLGNQIWRVERAILAGAEIVISDSPALLSCAYHTSPGIESLAREAHDAHETLNFLLVGRPEGFSSFGRIHMDPEAAAEVDPRVEHLLMRHQVTPIRLPIGSDRLAIALREVERVRPMFTPVHHAGLTVSA